MSGGNENNGRVDIWNLEMTELHDKEEDRFSCLCKDDKAEAVFLSCYGDPTKSARPENFSHWPRSGKTDSRPGTCVRGLFSFFQLDSRKNGCYSVSLKFLPLLFQLKFLDSFGSFPQGYSKVQERHEVLCFSPGYFFPNLNTERFTGIQSVPN